SNLVGEEGPLILHPLFETFGKTLIFVQVQGRRSRLSGINRRNTCSILRINPPKFGGGLKFEPVGT
ncbi:MAG TPA: hypothetical protein VLM43_10510, partial [Desulfobacterales bacterium]|nr:hypothetical protein [Desulfobacterales bacterium]